MTTSILCTACGVLVGETADHRFALFVASSLCRACTMHPPRASHRLAG